MVTVWESLLSVGANGGKTDSPHHWLHKLACTRRLSARQEASEDTAAPYAADPLQTDRRDTPPGGQDHGSEWELNEIKFPALSVMVHQYLGVPATSASAECLFSIAGHVYDDLRQNLKEEMLEMLMWACVNREKRHAKL